MNFDRFRNLFLMFPYIPLQVVDISVLFGWVKVVPFYLFMVVDFKVV
jgi:hypothetical protein